MEVNKSAKKKRESRALSELSRDHGYMFQKLRHRAERFTTQFTRNRKTGKSLLTPAVCIKLIVPVSSDLGEQIVAMYKEGDKKKRSKK